MEIEEKYIELFDKYIDGTLSEKWTKALEEKMSSEPDIAIAFEEHRMVRKSIDNEGRKLLKADLILTHATIGQDSYKKYKSNSKAGIKGLIKLLIWGALAYGIYYSYHNLDWQQWIPGMEEKQDEEPALKEENQLNIEEDQKNKPSQKTEDIRQEIFYDTVYKVITIDPNDSNSVKDAKNAIENLKREDGEIIIDTVMLNSSLLENNAIQADQNSDDILREALDSFDPELY